MTKEGGDHCLCNQENIADSGSRRDIKCKRESTEKENAVGPPAELPTLLPRGEVPERLMQEHVGGI